MSTTVQGFFYISGGKDRPFGYNDNLNFGFKDDGSGPEFKYSLSVIQDYYIEPLTIKSISNANGMVLSLLLEGLDHKDEFESIDINTFNSKGLDGVFKILEYSSLHQSTLGNTPSNTTDYSSIGDEYLSQNVTKYVKGSLQVYKSSIQNRVSYISFTITTDGTLKRNFIVYLTPDDLMVKHGLDFGRYTVKHNDYNKTNSNASILDIVSSIPFDVESKRNYTNCSIFGTRHVVFNSNGVEIYNFQQQFYIYSHMCKDYIVPPYKQVVIVKRFLEDKYNNDRELLKREYPDLFTDLDVDIYPLTNNLLDNKVVSPISIVSIIDELDKRGCVVDYDKYLTSVEVFILEGASEFDDARVGADINSIMRIPMVAIDLSGDTTTKGPISGTFPRFSILATGVEGGGSDWETFHFHIKLFVKILLHLIPGSEKYGLYSDEELVTNLQINPTMDVSFSRYRISDEVTYIKSVKFSMNGSTYRVYGYDYEGIYGPEQLA